MEDGPFSDARVIEQSAAFVCIRVNTEIDDDTMKKYEISHIPTVLFLKSNGEKLEELDRDEAEKMALQMERVAKAYKE
ncbi:MAG: hypothetical protein HYZ53_05795 [Planctomycetes bacterium]|nr:hypothetical protein [Planctomycetota bacterium]